MALLLPAFPLHVYGTFSFCTLPMCPLPCLTLPSPLFNRPPPCPWGSINIISSSEAADMNHRVTVNNSSSVPVPYLGIHTAWSLQSRLGAMYEILQCVCIRVRAPYSMAVHLCCREALIFATHSLTSSCTFFSLQNPSSPAGLYVLKRFHVKQVFIGDYFKSRTGFCFFWFSFLFGFISVWRVRSSQLLSGDRVTVSGM